MGTEITDPADLRYRAVSLRWVADRLKTSGARVRILIVDACRNNRWYEADRGPGQRGLERITPPSGTLIACAAAPGETARDKHPNRSKGLYTGELVQALAQEPEVESRQLIRRVGANVNRLSSGQNPSSEEIGFYASLPLADPKVVADPRVKKGPGSNFSQILAIADPQSRSGRHRCLLSARPGTTSKSSNRSRATPPQTCPRGLHAAEIRASAASAGELQSEIPGNPNRAGDGRRG